MDVETLRLGWDVLISLTSGAAIVISWRNRKSEEERKQTGLMLDRLQKLETTLEHQPTTRDIDVLRQDFARVIEGVSRLQGKVEANTEVTNMMNSYLISRDK